MAINIKFDLINNPEPPTLVLANRNGNKLGQLYVNHESVELIDKFNEASEISFTVNKYVDGKITNLWDKLVDFKLIYCKEWGCWFECKVELDEATESVKTVFCTQLGQAELSQIMLYNIEINTEDDIARDDYKIGILYDPFDSQASILSRLLEKAPHYSIIHIDNTLENIQRSFSFDDISIYDALQEIAEEIGCLFVFNSDSDENGMPQRTISVYDLQQNCNDCGYRGEFVDECPKCGSTNVKYGYGDDTLIFVTSDELASEGIQLVTDTDSVKNCFKLEAGDDLMTATIRNRNPNGTDYIWYFSEATKADMPKELVEKIDSYDAEYQYFYNDHVSMLDEDLLNQYNSIVDKYLVYNEDLQKISNPIKGFADLMQAYYNTIDLGWYLKSGLMPNITMSETDAEEQGLLLNTSLPSIIAVTNLKTVSKSTADSTVLMMAKAIVKSSYKVTISSSQLSDNNWSGSFIITNYSDDEDTYTTGIINRSLTDWDEIYLKQKIDKMLSKENADDLSITGLFEKGYEAFCAELKKYALSSLTSFHDACQACIDILIEQGVGNKDSEGYLETGVQGSLYNELYIPYYNKLMAIESEMVVRESEVNVILGTYDVNGHLITDGLQTNIENFKTIIQDSLNFQNYLGEDLWLQFCAYRREDKYSNTNYISDGLNNTELFERALEFYEVAENEIFKSAELQHSISATLNNLLAIPKFKLLVDSFNVGNWIRVQVDDYIYKLRLIEYEISYGDFNIISVKFSDVAKIKNGYSDLESILSNASSMASSYDSIQKQANLGNEARNMIRQWLNEGLDASLIQIQNNTNEDIVIDNNGLIGRSYSDITEEYSPEQIRLTHNIMAFTDDNWKSVRQAIGKHKYKYFDEGKNEFADALGYGMSADFVIGGVVSGSQIIGGSIYSPNYKSGESGTYFDLQGGDFELAGGRFVFDEDKGSLTLRNVRIQWDSLAEDEKPTIENISGLGDYLDEIKNLENQLDNRAETWYQDSDPSVDWTDSETKELHVGDLWHYTGETGIVNGVKRIKNSEWIWRETNGGYQWEPIEISDEVFDAIDGKAQIFTSTPVPPYYVGDLWVQGSTGDILHCVVPKIKGQSFHIDDWKLSSKYTDDSALNNFKESEFNPAKSLIDNVKIISDNLVHGLGFQETEITGQYIISPVIAGGSLLIGEPSAVHAQIRTDGKLICTGAEINGDIHATSLTLGENAKVPYDKLTGAPTIPTKLSDLENDLFIEEGDKIDISTSTDESTGITTTITTVGDKTYTTYTSSDASYLLTNLGVGSEDDKFFKVEKDGLLTAKNAMIWGTIYANAGEIGGCSIKNGKLEIPSAHISGTLNANQINMTGAITWNDLENNMQNTVLGINTTAVNAEGIAKNIANGTYTEFDALGNIKKTFISGTSIESPSINGGLITGGTIIGCDIMWGASGTVGGLTRTNGAIVYPDGTMSSTNLVHLWSTEGMYIQTTGGGIRIGSSSGVWFEHTADEIVIRNDVGTDWVNLKTYINSKASSVAVFG